MNAVCLTILRCRLIRVREMTAAGCPAASPRPGAALAQLAQAALHRRLEGGHHDLRRDGGDGAGHKRMKGPRLLCPDCLSDARVPGTPPLTQSCDQDQSAAGVRARRGCGEVLLASDTSQISLPLWIKRSAIGALACRILVTSSLTISSVVGAARPGPTA